MSATTPENRGQAHWIDLPYWAKSTNPIVRRHLGMYWRTIPPYVIPIVYISLAWIAILILGGIFPPLFNIIMPLSVASLLIAPAALVLFGHILLTITTVSARAMQEEMQNNTMPLLRTTPMSMNQILLGKIAAALWKRMDDLVLVGLLTAIFAAPILIMNYAPLFPTEEYPFVMNILVIIGIPVSLARVALEAVMVGVIAIFLGTIVPYRSTAIASAIAMSIFYFGFINLLRYLPGAQETIASVMLTDFVIPIVAAVAVIIAGLKLTTAVIISD